MQACLLNFNVTAIIEVNASNYTQKTKGATLAPYKEPLLRN